MYYETTITDPSDVVTCISKFLVNNGWTKHNSFTDRNVVSYPFERDGFCVIFSEALLQNGAVGRLFSQNDNVHKLTLTACDDYDSTKLFNQKNILVNTAGDVQGVGVCRYCGDDEEGYTTELRCISNIADGETYTFVLTTHNQEVVPIGQGEYYDSTLKKDIIIKKYCQYLSISKIVPITGISGKWLITGSYNATEVPTPELDKLVQGQKYIKMSVKKFSNKIKPLYSINASGTTFCRIGIDAAEIERNIAWASACSSSSQSYTGKELSTSITESGFASIPLVPHIGYLQSTSNTDFGRNTNTLNCISTNLPIALFVLRDPDLLNNYSQIGYIGGVFFVSLRNMAPLKKYEVSNPGSGLFYQVFPMCVRGGKHGYDGISIPRPADDEIAL